MNTEIPWKWMNIVHFQWEKPIENLRQINNNAQFDPENRSYCEWEVILPPLLTGSVWI